MTAKRYRVEVVHGERRTVCHVVDSQAPEADQPAILASYDSHSKATDHAARLNSESRP